jgi:hypothetical protein
VSVQARKTSGEGRLPHVDIAKGEATEKELDALIRRRHNHRVVEEGERPAEEAWMESERRYTAQRREDNRAAWCEYHQNQAARHRATLAALATYHESEAAKLQRDDAVEWRGEGAR